MLKLTDDHISAVLDSDINHQNCDDMSADKKYDFALELLTAESPEVALVVP